MVALRLLMFLLIAVAVAFVGYVILSTFLSMGAYIESVVP